MLLHGKTPYLAPFAIIFAYPKVIKTNVIENEN